MFQVQSRVFSKLFHNADWLHAGYNVQNNTDRKLNTASRFQVQSTNKSQAQRRVYLSFNVPVASPWFRRLAGLYITVLKILSTETLYSCLY